MDKDEIIKELAEKNAKLEEELQATKEHLKKYTAPVCELKRPKVYNKLFMLSQNFYTSMKLFHLYLSYHFFL